MRAAAASVNRQVGPQSTARVAGVRSVMLFVRQWKVVVMRPILIAALCALPGVAIAQQPPAKPETAAPQAFVPASPEAEANRAALDKMMQTMHRQPTGDADRDFVAMMIPLHEGAIEMAEIELKYGIDPRLKQLAARMIGAQQREIGIMQSWAVKHDSAQPRMNNPRAQWK